MNIVQPVLYFLLRPSGVLNSQFIHLVIGSVITLPFNTVWPTQTLYQFANLHDVTWGNRPISQKAASELAKTKDDYQ